MLRKTVLVSAFVFHTSFLVFGLFGASGGDTLASKYAGLITEQTLKTHLEIIASDAFEGRETGTEGQKKAAAYLAEKFETYGLKKGMDTTYYQTFLLSETKIAKASISFKGEELVFLSDFYFFSGMSKEGRNEFENLTFLGYGIDDVMYSDYNQLKGQVDNILVWQGEPEMKNGNFLISGSNLKSAWSKDFSVKLDVARERGVKNLFIISDDFKSDLKRYAYYVQSPKLGLQKKERKNPEMSVYFISPEAAKRLLGAEWSEKKIKADIAKRKEFKAITVLGNLNIEVSIQEKLIETENLLGVIEGSDLKDEYVVLTAHYDHLGKRGEDIFNGADDDGSGTVALLEIGRALALAKAEGNGPRRTVLILPVSGEEKGLLGSEYYAANPVFPLEQTIANLNIDMIGRTDEAHQGNSNYVYLIGSNRLSTGLHELSEEVNSKCCNLFLDYTFNDPNDPNRFYYRSDHYNFIKNGIPAIFYFSGVHEDYHRPTDTVEKIEFGKMTEIARLVFHTAWAIAHTNNDLSPNVFEDEQ
jgi:hypothetical protein